MLQLQVDIKKFEGTFDALKGRIGYSLGGKVPELNIAPSTIHQSLDCSGWERYQVFQSSGIVIPDGSWLQREWCESNLEQVPYGPAHDDMIIAFLTAGVNGVGNVGHVWNVRNANTYECYGGHGVGSRPWDTPILKDHVHKAFRLPIKLTGYNLIASDGHCIATLPVFNGHSYVSARDWGKWFALNVQWDDGKVLFNGNPVPGEVKILREDGENRAYVPFTQAAAMTNLSYTVNNTGRQINLVGRQ